MRRAVTLIEMVVTISVAATLTGIAISLLLVMFRAERNARMQLAEAQSLQRLSDQFRQDVHAAVGQPVGNAKGSNQWRFDLGEKRAVRYEVVGNAMSREETGDSKPVRRESYLLPEESQVTIAVDRKAKPVVVSLTIEPREAALRPRPPLRVDAVLGRDLRFGGRAKEGK